MYLHTHRDIVQESSPLQQCKLLSKVSLKLSKRSRVYFEDKKEENFFRKIFSNVQSNPVMRDEFSQYKKNRDINN